MVPNPRSLEEELEEDEIVARPRWDCPTGCSPAHDPTKWGTTRGPA